MKGRVIALGPWAGRSLAALMVDGALEELLVDPPDDVVLPGAIFRATADRPVKGLGGIFVKLPGGASGFLRQISGVAPGQRLIVQVTGPAEPGKALPVTHRLLFKGRYAIVTPGAPGVNVSRRLQDEGLRAGLLALAAEAGASTEAEAPGVILRSAAERALAEGAGDEVTAEIAALLALSAQILADADGPPELLLEGALAADVAAREWRDPPPDEICEGERALEDLGLPEQIAALLRPDMALPGGASLRIEVTRALVAVDVNTGPDTSPAAALKANISAARALPRALRLRGLGGQVVIDFAPLPKRDRTVLDQVLRTAFKGEGAETHLAGWTALGLYELVRKRDRLPLAALLPGAAP